LRGEKISAFSRIMSVKQEFSERKTVAAYFPEHIGPNYGGTNKKKIAALPGITSVGTNFPVEKSFYLACIHHF
jgi:hypothetical protein